MNRAPGPAGGRRPTTTGIRRSGAHAPTGPQPTTEWLVVVPVKGTVHAKSRFGAGDNSELALAMAADTVSAAMAAERVAGVLVVTSVEASGVFDDLGAFVVVEDCAAGLAAAIARGLATAAELSEPGRGVAVLLGDLPALAPAELAAALDAARSRPRAMVPDASGDGTVLVTAASGSTHSTAFGVGSSAAHRAAGYAVLDVDPASGLRNDVDSLEGLEALTGRLGERTARWVARVEEVVGE